MEEVFLAHAGGMLVPASEPGNLSIEAVYDDTTEEAMRAERKGFADSEAEPDADELRRRLTLHRTEMGGQGHFLLAKVAGESASVVAFYTGEDSYVHHLAGAREHALPLDHHKRGRERAPGRLYRSLGFTDKVYWRRQYKHGPDTERTPPA